MDPLLLTGIIVTLLLSAFFSGIEIAFVSADKLHIELRSQNGSFSSRLLAKVARIPAMFIGTTLVGNTAALVFFSSLMATAMTPIIEVNIPGINEVGVMLIQTLLSTLIVLPIAEFVPKSLFLISPNNILSFFAVPIRLISILLWPVVFIVVQLSRLLITGIFKAEFSEEKPAFGLTDLNNYLLEIVSSSPEEESPEVDTKIFSNALDFKRIKVRECMIPRTELVAIDITASVSELKRAFIDSGYSKILVYKDSIDDIIGYCHSSMMFRKPKNVKQIVTKVSFVPEAQLANELMVDLISQRKSMAVVVDEFGGTSGLVTIEDIIEEIFGDIQDEHDAENLEEQEIGDGMYIFSGRQEIDYLNETYDLEIPEGDYDTLGGFILHVNGDIPAVNEVVKTEFFEFTIKAMDGIKIDRVILTKSNPQEGVKE